VSDHQFDALDRDMLVEIAIGQRAEIERLRAEVENFRARLATQCGMTLARALERDELLAALRPFAAAVNSSSLHRALGHISREHLIAAHAAILKAEGEK
jgi:hypothetical protein